VPFWFKTLARYALVVVLALVSSALLSLLSTMVSAKVWGWKGDSPAYGLFSLFLFVGCAILIIPLSLGVTAELVERNVQARRFSFTKALWRVLAALPMTGFSLYAWGWVTSTSRARYWIEALLYCLSGLFAYVALRVRRHTASAC
jgi:hypothetical protein